jgi:hypothetical protein
MAKAGGSKLLFNTVQVKTLTVLLFFLARNVFFLP